MFNVIKIHAKYFRKSYPIFIYYLSIHDLEYDNNYINLEL